MIKNVFIIGARGYHYNYGGWETFVSKLVDNYNDKKTLFHISEISDKQNNKVVTNKINDNISVDSFYIKQSGSTKMLICTIKAFNYYLDYIKKNNIKNAYIYVLGLKLGPMLSLKKKQINKLGIKIIINPDGLEHERAKWNTFIKKFFLLSEKWMVKNSDIIICDAIGIKKYLDNKYPSIKDKTTYIAYGTNKIDTSELDEKEVLKKYKLESKDYFLMVGRFVPENNYELVINSFMKTKTNKKLVIVSNISTSTYYNELITKNNCLDDKRIIFYDGIYNEIELTIIRKNALAYIHGHSVGGTNPSLLEALDNTNINILFDVEFNKDIGKDSCLYFNNENKLINIIDNINTYDEKQMGLECKKIINDKFRWNLIVNEYKKIFK